MAKIKKRATRRAARMTAKHMVHGTVSKSRRAPFRSGGLLGLGALIGVGVGWVFGRSRTRRQLGPGLS